MEPYPKIESLFVRDSETHKCIEGQYRKPEFEYLRYTRWQATEKVDGVNIRIAWIPGGRYYVYNTPKSGLVTIKGRSDKTQIPGFLTLKLTELFLDSTLRDVFPDSIVTLYGEGYGARIQKRGAKYIPDGVSFVLFDVFIDGRWLGRADVEDVAQQLSIDVVPVVSEGTLRGAVNTVKAGLKSQWGDFEAEGLVLKPVVPLNDRTGNRIITKIKGKDFG